MSFLSRWFGKRSPQMKASDLVAAIKRAVGDDLVCVALYGSVASGEYQEGSSDVNLLVVTKKLDAPALKRLSPAGRTWVGSKVKPVFFTPDELERMAEVFPMEFLDIQENRRLIFGEDLFRRLAINRRNLRNEVEQEVKSKIRAFRQGVLAAQGGRKQVSLVIAQSLVSLMPVFRSLIRMKKQRPPRQRQRLLEDISRIFDLQRQTLEEALSLRYGGPVLSAAAQDLLFEKYMMELERLSSLVDRMDADGNVSQAPRTRPERDAREVAGERDHGRGEGRGEGREGRGGREGREGRRGRDRDRGRDRGDRGRGGPGSGEIKGKQEKLAEVMAILSQEPPKKRWDPKEPERFQSDPMSRDASRPVGERFGWDRAWKKPGAEAGGAEAFAWDNDLRQKERRERLERRLQKEGGVSEAAPEEKISTLSGEPAESPVPAADFSPSPASAPEAPAAAAPEAPAEAPAPPRPAPRPAKVDPVRERLPEEKFNW